MHYKKHPSIVCSWIYMFLALHNGHADDIRDLSKEFFTDVRVLDLSNRNINGFEPVAFTGFTKVEKLILVRNRLKEIPKIGDAAATLQLLDMAFNRLTAVQAQSFVNMSSLIYLSLAYNDLTEFPDIGPIKAQIKELNLNFNSIKTIPRGTFQGWFALHTMKMTNNLLTTFPDLCSAKATLSRKVQFSNNDIKTILPSTLHGLNIDNLEAFKMTGNPLNCNCLMIHVKQSTVKYLDEFECFFPSILRGMTLQDVTADNMTCKSLQHSDGQTTIGMNVVEDHYTNSPPVVRRMSLNTMSQCAAYCALTHGCYYFNIRKGSGGLTCDITSTQVVTGLVFSDTHLPGWKMYSVS